MGVCCFVNMLVMGLVIEPSLMVISITGILLYAKVPPLYSVQVNEKSFRWRMATYRDGVKRKGDKIGMGV